MEYFLGSAITLAIVYLLLKFDKNQVEDKKLNIVFNQSHKHDMLRDYIPINIVRKQLNTQSSKDMQKNLLRIIFMEGKAYWIKNNAVYSADIIDGQIEKDNAKVLDILAMDDIQLKKTP